MTDQTRYAMSRWQFIEAVASDRSLSLSSNKLEGCTQAVTIYRISNLRAGRLPIFIVDVPGFVDSRISAMGIVSMLKKLIESTTWYFTLIVNIDWGANIFYQITVSFSYSLRHTHQHATLTGKPKTIASNLWCINRGRCSRLHYYRLEYVGHHLRWNRPEKSRTQPKPASRYILEGMVPSHASQATGLTD